MQTQSSTVKTAYTKLRDMCVTLELRPNLRINESKLAKSLAISRTPLREALNRLEAEGFVYSIQGEGFFCDVMNNATILDIFELRHMVLKQIIENIAQTTTENEFSEISHYWADIDDAFYITAPVSTLNDYETLFLNVIADQCNNDKLNNLIQIYNDQTVFLRQSMMRDVPSVVSAYYNSVAQNLDQITSRKEYMALIECIKSTIGKFSI